MFLILCSLFCIAFYLLYRYAAHKYSYWSSRGIAGPRPLFPFGFILEKAFSRPERYELENFRRFGPVYGVYTGTLPTLTIAEPALVRQVLVTDFSRYCNRRRMKPFHPIWNRNMANLEGDQWRRVRSLLTPAFSSAKLRAMYPLMDRCVERLVGFVSSKVTENKSGSSAAFGQINAKDALAGFAIDVIASTAFATETDANNVSVGNGNGNGEAKSDFVYYGNSIFKVPPIKMAATMFLPRFILSLLGITVFFSEASFRFMIGLSRKIIQERKAKLLQSNGSGNGRKATTTSVDFVQLMMNSSTTDEQLKSVDLQTLAQSIENEREDDEKKEEEEEEEEEIKSKTEEAKKVASFLKSSSAKQTMLGEDEMVSQCVLFFFAGFETSAFQGTVALFELAHHPEMQERLFAEVAAISAAKHSTGGGGGGSTDETEFIDALLTQAPYLEAVVKESLRKYPNVVRLERRVSAPEGATLAGVHLDEGVLVEVPTMAIHHNPEYYPEPELFKPERFLPENKHLLVPYTFLPFGDGPRNCVGMRFAFQEIKLALARLVLRFRFRPAPDTPAKLIFAPGSLMLVCEPFHLKVERR